MNNSFNLSRFWLYTKAEFCIERRKLLLGGAIAFGVAVLMYALAIFFSRGELNSGSVVTVGAMMLQIIAVTCALYISSSFVPFLKRGIATQNMMLPVSTAEKFTYRLMKAIVVPVALVLIAIGVSCLFVVGNDAIKWNVYDDLGIVVQWSSMIIELLESLSFYIFIFSLFFLGAIVWRRSHFIKTLGVMVGVGAIFMNVILWFILTAVKLDLGAGWIAVLVALTVGAIYVSWRQFRKLQITK